MTAAFDALTAVASGRLEFSFVIEGVDVVFCTSEEMAGDLGDGRFRIPGLRHTGLGFSERVYLAGAEHDITIDAVNIDEVGGEWLGEASRVFTTIATRICSLYSTLTAAGTTAYVTDGNADLFTVNSHYYLGTETVKVTAKTTVPSPDELTITRARWDTVAQEHVVVAGEAAQVSDIYDAPTGMAGRRVWLYAHTSSELTTSDTGTCVWRGILGREPALADDDALSWALAVESRARSLDASLAGGFDEGFKLRGIYYPGAAQLRLTITRYTTASATTIDAEATVDLAGFWETQDAFCAALTAAIMANATVSGWGVTFYARSFPGDWDLVYRAPAADPRYMSVYGGSYVDGFFSRVLAADPVTSPHADVPTAVVLSAVASTEYVAVRTRSGSGSGTANLAFADMRKVPRMSSLSWCPVMSDSDVATYPLTRIYLSRLGALSSSDDLTCSPQWNPDDPYHPYTEDPPAQVLRIASVSSSTGSVICAEGGIATQPARIMASGSRQPTITGAARYASGDGDLEDFRADLVSRAPTVANRGRGPWTTSDDFPAGGWTTAVSEASAGRAWLEHRVYTYSQATKAIDVIREDLKLYGLIPYLDADARLAVRAFTVGGSAIELAVTASEIIADESLGTVTGDADGLVTVVHLLRGYDPAEDKHVERDFVFRGLSAIARVHDERVLEIAPKSRALGAEPEWSDVYDRARSLITLFGDRRTQIVAVDVSLVAWSVLVGDTITLTVAALPSDGGRTEWGAAGMAARAGIVIGRRWDLSVGVGRLEVLLHELEVRAYTPSCRVTGASGAGTTWTLTVTATHYSEDGDTSHLVAGQSIRIIEWDVAAPTIREGTIATVTSSTSIDVELSAAWGGMGGATYYTLTWDTSDDAETTATQLQRAFVATAAGRIPLSGGSTSPSGSFAP